MSKPLPTHITLYHGSLAKNRDAILKNGIKYVPVDDKVIKEKVDEAHKEISKKLNVEKFSKNDMVTMRLNEARSRGGVVYLSASKEYSVGNSLAGQEWKEYLVLNALQKKFKREYSEALRLNTKKRRLLRKVETCHEKEMDALVDMRKKDYESWKRKRKQFEAQYYEAEKEESVFLDKFHKKTNRYKNKVLSWNAVLFKVELPWSKFKELATDDQREEIEHFEERWKSGWFEERQLSKGWSGETLLERMFGEVHLRYVPLEYIKEVGSFRKPRWRETEKIQVKMKKLPKGVMYV